MIAELKDNFLDTYEAACAQTRTGLCVFKG